MLDLNNLAEKVKLSLKNETKESLLKFLEEEEIQDNECPDSFGSLSNIYSSNIKLTFNSFAKYKNGDKLKSPFNLQNINPVQNKNNYQLAA